MTKINKTLNVPDYNKFTAEYIRPAFEEYRQQVRQSLERVKSLKDVTYDDLYGQERINLTLKSELDLEPFFHIKSVKETDEIRQAYLDILPELVQLNLEVSQNEDVYKKVKQLKDSDKFNTLTHEQRRIVEKELLDYRLNGIDLSKEDKVLYAKLVQELSELTTTFSNNNLDSRQSWSYLITDIDLLKGVPEINLELFKQQASEKELDGYLLTLDDNCVQVVLKFCEVSETRKLIFFAQKYIASPKDGNNGAYDNTEIVNLIYKKKQELAKLLGFRSYAELSLVNKMAENPKQVLDFLKDIRDRVIEPAQKLRDEVIEFGKTNLGLDEVNSWDVSYCLTQYTKHKFDLDPEEVRQYFPQDYVLAGLFKVIEKLYGVTFKEDKDYVGYRPEVKFYEVYENGELISGIVVDLYAAKGKRSGAWMNQPVGRQLYKNELKLPVAVIVGNFTPPTAGKSALLNHDEVTTLFHEMGHALHLLLTKTENQELCGTNVEWDAVELPSQILENWCTHPDSLRDIARHHQTGEPMPEELINKLVAKSLFDENPLFVARQVQFALFDMELFSHDVDSDVDVHEVYSKVDDEISAKITRTKEESYFPNVFSHIFAGGYTAGYYSYMWANVLAVDAFDAFVETGNIYNKDIATKFKDEILAKGGSFPSMDNYVRFRGRKPDTAPLLKRYGLI